MYDSELIKEAINIAIEKKKELREKKENRVKLKSKLHKMVTKQLEECNKEIEKLSKDIENLKEYKSKTIFVASVDFADPNPVDFVQPNKKNDIQGTIEEAFYANGADWISQFKILSYFEKNFTWKNEVKNKRDSILSCLRGMRRDNKIHYRNLFGDEFDYFLKMKKEKFNEILKYVLSVLEENKGKTFSLFKISNFGDCKYTERDLNYFFMSIKQDGHPNISFLEFETGTIVCWYSSSTFSWDE